MPHTDWYSCSGAEGGEGVAPRPITAAVDTDGKFRIIVAERDPGYANWLDTCEHMTGLVQYRRIWTRDNPPTTARIVPVDSLATALPLDSRRVSPQDRHATIAHRQAHVVRREWL